MKASQEQRAHACLTEIMAKKKKKKKKGCNHARAKKRNTGRRLELLPKRAERRQAGWSILHLLRACNKMKLRQV